LIFDTNKSQLQTNSILALESKQYLCYTSFFIIEDTKTFAHFLLTNKLTKNKHGNT
jgi:hypothetical protein